MHEKVVSSNGTEDITVLVGQNRSLDRHPRFILEARDIQIVNGAQRRVIEFGRQLVQVIRCEFKLIAQDA